MSLSLPLLTLGSSFECRHLLVHGLGWPGVFERFYQLGHLEQHSVKRGSSLV